MPLIATDAWTPIDGIDLEPNADTIVRSESNYAVTAGPGAGKTELLAQRACFLLQTGRCPAPRKILAISFKRDAASNLAERVKKRCGDDLSARFESKTFDAFSKGLVDRFLLAIPEEHRPNRDYSIVFGNRPLDKNNVSFLRLMELAKILIETNPQILRAIRLTYSHLFLDEFQDTTGPQYDLISTIFLKSETVVTAVGDERQRIMGWANALPNSFTDFINDFQATKLPLEMNHRCAPNLVKLQNLLAKSFQPDALDVVPSPKWLPDDGSCEFILFDDCVQESASISEKIFKWVKIDGIPCREIAILLRKKPAEYSSRLQIALGSLGIKSRDEDPFQRLMQDPFVVLLIHFLMIVFGKKNSDTWSKLRTLVLEVYGILDREDDAVRAAKIEKELQQAISSARKAHRHKGENFQISDAIACLTEFIGAPRIKAYVSAYESEANVEKVIADVSAHLVASREASNGWAEAIDCFLGVDSIPIMTVHKSKGLEYRAVAVLGLEETAYSSYVSNPSEESSVIYVAVSRAKEILLMTRAESRIVAWRTIRNNLSATPLLPIYKIFRAAGVNIERITSAIE